MDATAVNLDPDLVRGVLLLQHRAPAVLAALIAAPEGRAAEAVVRTFGHHGATPQSDCATTRWALLDCLPAPELVRLLVSVPSAATPVLVALPPPLLVRVARLPNVAKAFPRTGRWGVRLDLAIVYPTLETGVIRQLATAGRDTDVELLDALAALPAGEQRGYLDRALAGRMAEAAAWVAIPRWQRALLPRDKEAEEIWSAFRLLYLHLEGCDAMARETGGKAMTVGARANFWRTFGGKLAGEHGVRNPERWSSVFTVFGWMLEHEPGRLGDVATPPWSRSSRR